VSADDRTSFYVDRALFDAKIRPPGIKHIKIEFRKPRRMLALEGDQLATVDLVVGGQIRLSRVSRKREFALALLIRGDVVTLQSTSPYQAFVMRSTILARIPRSVFETLRANNREFAARIERSLQRRASLLEQRIAFSGYSATARVALALLEISEYCEGRSEIERPTHGLIASFVGVTRETVTVEMQTLKRVRAVVVSRDSMTLDLERLRGLLREG